MAALPELWMEQVGKEFEKPYMQQLREFLKSEKSSGNLVYPPNSDVFTAFNFTDFNQVKVVILGQDPYHGKGQAHGLSFSVPEGIPVPPSLKNIYKELNDDVDISIPQTGNLSKWAKQGVFMLNSTLTVRAGVPGSHQNKGWELFTDQVISSLSQNRNNLVFMLWGKYAQAKTTLINAHNHLILSAAHPSPFSAHTGFYGCKHFSLANEYLENNGKEGIDWQI